MNEKQKYIGGVDFEELRSQRIQVYKTITFDLATARSNVELPFIGNYLYVIEATDNSANIQIRLNEIFRSNITVTKGRGLRAPFYRLYITNTAQTGKTLTFAIGVESGTFEVIDTRASIAISGAVTTTPSHLASGASTEEAKMNPSSGALLADTGQLDAGFYNVEAWANSIADTYDYVYFQHRNAANDADILYWTTWVQKSLNELKMRLMMYELAQNERLRILVPTDITSGAVQGTIVWVRKE